ncbi:MAG: LysM peptidoglycan-binding domain-containing protein [Clostridiales bacterium]|nr:LysM peptidoglycan-binding domain-containing protein [Clostridiales bacterium]
MSINDYPAKLTDGYYYVRTAWEDEESQVGQYRTLKSAIARADANPGTHIFTGDGIAIYPEDEETVTVSEGTEEITLDEPEAIQDDQIQAETEGSEEVAAGTETPNTEDSGASEEGATEPTAEEIAEAQTEALAEGEYPNDGNTETILYARANTLLNVRSGNSLDADKVTVIKKGTVVEVLELCDNGWYRIKCEAAECGYAYVSNAIGTYFNTGTSLYTVQPSDSLWKIAEKTLNDGKKYTDIKAANNLTSNYIRVGMQLLIP